MNIIKKMKGCVAVAGNVVRRGSMLVAAAVASVVALGAGGLAKAEAISATAATDGITSAITLGTTVVVAGFGIGVLFLVARVVRRGMRAAG